MKKAWLNFLIVSCALIFNACETPKSKEETPASTSNDVLDRTVLPIKEPTYPNETELDARKATAPARFEIKAHKDSDSYDRNNTMPNNTPESHRIKTPAHDKLP